MHPTEWFSERPWDTALFTTYALSLSFFESVILHRLREAGCRDIWVLADADGYRASLAERRSAGVGREYRLIPIGLPHGVFHPKCVFLSGSEGSLLLVGSGNLTFGGYGRNLEVIEVLSPESSPLAILDFAEFVESLGKRQDIIVPDRSWISRFADVARRSVAGVDQSSHDSQPRLIHSVNRPVVDGIADLCAGGNQIKDIHVLSPFHDTNGHAVKTLAERVQCNRIYIGIPSQKGKITTFPFPEAKKWSQKVSAVLPVIGNHKDRKLHAKWIELSDGLNKLTITGSINSTSQALCSTNNIELGVLRFGSDKNEWVAWKDTLTPKDFERTKFTSSGLRNSCLVHAHLEKEGLIRGQILSSSTATGVWKARVVSPTGDSSDFSTQVNESNSFAAHLRWDSKYGLSSSLQILMTQGDREARGWVHVQEYLNLPQQARRILGTLVRLASHEETEDDYIALLEYLAVSTAKDLLTFRRQILFEHENGKEDGPDETSKREVKPVISVRIKEIEPKGIVPSDNECGALDFLDSTELLDRWLSNLRRRLLGGRGLGQSQHSDRKAGEIAIAPAGTDEEEETGEDEKQAYQGRMDSALNKFDRHMRSLLSDEKAKAKDKFSGQVLVTWLEVKLPMLLERFSERSAAVGFVKDWFKEACQAEHLRDEETALEQHIFTVAALLPNLTSPDDCNSHGLSQIHDLLERFCAGEVPFTRAHSSLLRGRGVGFETLFFEEKTVDLENNLARILQTPTLRQEILQVIRDAEIGRPLAFNLPVFDGVEGKAFREALNTPAGRQSIDMVKNDWGMCPHQYYKLKSEVLIKLEDDRVALCNWCGRVMIRVTA
jgi:hypothetical protein